MSSFARVGEAAPPFRSTQTPQQPDFGSLKTLDLIKQLERRFHRDGGKLVISLDRLDWCKGLPQKLIAMESLYERFPQWREKVTFFLVVREQEGTMKHDRQLRQMVNRLVGKVRWVWRRGGECRWCVLE